MKLGKIDTKKETTTTTTQPSAQQSGALQPMLTKRSITHDTGNISSLTYPLTAMNNDATIINRILVCLTKKSLEMYIATFRLLTASLRQAMGSTARGNSDYIICFIFLSFSFCYFQKWHGIA